MTIASDIIRGRTPDYDAYVHEGESLDDIDEYGFTPLIESAIVRRIDVTEQLIARRVDINKPDMTGRSALHWAVDNNDEALTKLLLEHGANPNAYTKSGLSVLVYPILREQDAIKQLLYRFGAKLDFALDFIYGKLVGHRYSLTGDVDIINPSGEFIELDYEGFILEFTVAVILDSLRRFTSSYSTRHLREIFPFIYPIMDALHVSEELLQLQHHIEFNRSHISRLQELIRSPMLILPAASRGHAMCFVKYHELWSKC
jgi:FOG: Ankyrin repeat